MELEKYVRQNLPKALESITESERLNELPNLSIYEKAIIFAYTDVLINPHKDLNEMLWANEGSVSNIFGDFLEECLDKLENYSLTVFRGVQESVCDVERYIKAQELKTNITEYGFLSASKSQFIAYGFGRIQFIIYSKAAKDIENISKFKREKEVLFKRNTSFKVLKVSTGIFFTIITLREI